MSGHLLIHSYPDDQVLPSLDEATLSVDALVADSTTDDFDTPSLSNFDTVGSRSSTPSVPPGFGIPLPHEHPLPPTQQEIVGKPPSRIVPTSAPFTPSRSSSFIPRTATPLSNVSLPEGATSQARALDTSVATFQAKQDVKALATNTGLSKTIVSQSAQALRSDDFPALDSASSKMATSGTSASSKSQPPKPAATVTSKKAAAAAPPSGPKSDKRSMPGILNISVPSKTTNAPDTPNKSSATSSAFPPLPPSTPSSASAQSTLPKNTPKTLRLVPAKPEAVAGGSGTPSSVTSTFPPGFPPGFPPSRQPSLASISRQERPGTPTSEVVSDTASITTASLSRANSPPPVKIGSAPLRITTKSKQKKQRREAQKEKEKELEAAAATKPEPEIEIAPIMGRKKKQKKERSIHSAAGGSTPVASRPASPIPAVPEKQMQEAESEVEFNKPAGKAKNKGKDSGKSKGRVDIVPRLTPIEKEEEITAFKPPSLPTPGIVYQQLVVNKELPDPGQLAFLKNPSTVARTPHPNFELETPNMMQKLTITPEDRATLLAGKPVHKNNEAWDRVMLTPNGDYVRHLAPEEEARYLDLQERIAEHNGPTAFVSTKHHANNGFTLVGGRAVPNGPPSFFPPPKGSTAPLDPVSKLQRDEALSYINQYVLPSLSTNSQLEKALNANALDAEMFRSTDHLNFSWGNDPHPSDNSSGLPPQEGILAATGLEGMAANFAGDNGGRPLGNVSLLSLSDAESAMQAARKDAESAEKKFMAALKRNRRLLLGSSGF